jgi:beta-glucanase (GH16 family)
VEVDGTAWHDWAVEWTPERIVGYVDGEEWFSSTDPATFPPGPMHLCIQLDWFPQGTGEVRESRMEVDRVAQYALDEGATTGGGGLLDRMLSWS